MDKLERISSGVDWLTITKPTDAPHIQKWVRQLQQHIERVAEYGNQLQKRVLLGYTGISSGNCFIGRRDDGYLAQFTGSYADGLISGLYDADCHIPRIDVQVTAQYAVMPPDEVNNAYIAATRANNELPAARRRKLTTICGSDGGATLYIGSMSSEQRGRMYNKEVQSEDITYTRCWRYEVVFKNHLATRVAERIATSEIDPSELCMRIVAAWYRARGVQLNWDTGVAHEVLPLQRSLPTDLERSLSWLRQQVRPTIRRLCEAGMRDTLVEILFPNAEQEDI